MDNIKLNGDTISNLRQFYEQIRLAFHSSFTKPVDILPPFRDISPNHSFIQLLVPGNEYYIGYYNILNTYNWYASALYAGLKDPKTIPPKQAPLAARVIQMDKSETDGWNILYLLLSTRNPLLGGKGDDVIMEITNLRIRNDDDIHTFYERVVNIQEKLDFSTEIISKTKLLEKYLQAMIKSTNHHHLLQYFVVELNLHITQEGHNIKHPTITIHTIYRHLIATNAPLTFNIKSIKKYKPNISQLTMYPHNNKLHDDNTEPIFDDIQEDPIENETTSYPIHDDTTKEHSLQYDPTIQAFRHYTSNRPRIICEACGISGHPATKCFRRGFTFLPRDIQRRISAYNTKYGDTPIKDTSPQTNQKHILPAPETKLPHDSTNISNNNNDTPTNSTQQATIQKPQHVLHHTDQDPTTTENDDNIEFINSMDITINTPVINVIKTDTNTTHHRQQSNSDSYINPLSNKILNDNGEVNTHDLHELQDQLFHPTPHEFFTPYRHQNFHVDTGANVHATNTKNDFLIFYPNKKTINIAAGQQTQSTRFGVVMVTLIPNHPPIPLAPVYYCPTATTGTLSPRCLELYNKCKTPTHKLFRYLSFLCPT